jgi:hypothetical protein
MMTRTAHGANRVTGPREQLFAAHCQRDGFMYFGTLQGMIALDVPIWCSRTGINKFSALVERKPLLFQRK